MKKTLKITTGILVGTLSIAGVTNLDVATAQGVVKINVEEKNQNVTAQITEENGKNYIVVTAQDKEVKNLYVRAKASNNQNFVFKLEKLSAGQTVKFEVKLAEVKVEGKKALPKTSVVKESVNFSGYIGEIKLDVAVTYEVEKEDKPATPVTPTKEVKPEDKLATPVTPTKEVKPEDKPATPVTPTTEVKPEDKPATPVTPTTEVKPEEKPATSTGELTAEQIKAAEEALKATENKDVTVTPATEVKAEEKPATEELTAEQIKAAEEALKAAGNKVATTTPATPVSTGTSTGSAVQTTPAVTPTTPVVTTPVSTGTSTRSAVQTTPAVTKPTTNAVSTTQTVGTSDEAVATQIFQLLNEYRVANKKAPLTVNNAALQGTAVRASEFAELVIANKTQLWSSHKRPDGSDWHTAFPNGVALGENLAYNVSAEAIMNWWKGSTHHNDNMLSEKYKSVAIKVVKVGNTYYAVQIFG